MKILRMESLLSAFKRSAQHQLNVRLPYLAHYFGNFHLLEDRRLLEQVIFPYIADQNSIQRVVFAGCDWYTKPYERHFRKKEYSTLEIDPKKRKYGARLHVSDALWNLPNHVPAGFFDTIICNGVFMITAVEKREEAEACFQACYQCLRSKGLFILGWNDTLELRPYPPEESEILTKFERFSFPPWSTARYLTNTDYRHVYSFFVKPEEDREEIALG